MSIFSYRRSKLIEYMYQYQYLHYKITLYKVIGHVWCKSISAGVLNRGATVPWGANCNYLNALYTIRVM